MKCYRKSLVAAVVAFCVSTALVAGAFAGTCTWIGTGTTTWGTESNWQGGLMPAADGSDDVIFANSAAADITLGAAAKVKSLSVTSAKVTLKSSTVTLTEGVVNVAAGATLSASSVIKGTAKTYPFVKIGEGTMEMRAICNTFKHGEIREGTFKAYVSGGGNNVNLQDISIFDGATFAYGNDNCVANDTVFDVQEGGTLSFNGCTDFISSISGAGRILGTGTAYLSLTRGSCVFSGTVENAFTINFGVGPSTPGDARFVVGTATGCANLTIALPDGTAGFSPFDRLAFSPGLGSAKLKSIPFRGEHETIWPVDQDGGPVQLVGTSISFVSSTNTVDTIGVNGGTLLLNDNAQMTVADGISKGTTFQAAKATSALTFAGGTAVNPTFTKSAAAGSLVLAGGETIDGTWSIAEGSATTESAVVVSGGVHCVKSNCDLSRNRVLRQTGGEVTFMSGINGYNSGIRSADIMVRVSGGKFTHISHASNHHRGIGLDASGDAQVTFKFPENAATDFPRVASDGDSHTFRVRDNAHVDMKCSLNLMYTGSTGSATGTVDIAGGTFSMAGRFLQPSTKKAFPSFLQFNGGTLRYYGLTSDLNNGHGVAHSIQVGETPARVTLDVDNCERKVTFDTPFSQNPTNTVADGGLVKDGSGTLVLAGGATLTGPVEIKAGRLSSLGVPGSGSLTLRDAAWCPTDGIGTFGLASVAGGQLVYAGASQLTPDGTTQGATYVIGPDDATSSVLAAADASSVLFLRNKTSNAGLGTAYKVKVNGKAAGREQNLVFAVEPSSANATGFLSFLNYDEENGYVPATMTAFAEAGASDWAEVTAATTVADAKAVRGLRLQKANLTVGSGATLTVGDGIHPAVVLLNGITSDATPNSLSGDGTVAFGNSRGYLLASAHGSSYKDAIGATLVGENGVVFAALPDATSAFRVTGANTYDGGTWISGVRVYPAHAQCFGASRDVYVTGNAAWGGELFFNSDSVSELDCDLHLSGVGRPVSGVGEGAVRAEKNTTLKGVVELVGDTRMSTSSASVTLTLSGDVTGAGRLESYGLGTLKLSGTSMTWTGGARVSGGTLAVASVEALGTGEIEVGSYGTLQFDNVEDITVTNAIVGTGRIELLGPGSVCFTNMADFKGRIVMGSDGVLEVKGETVLPALDHKGKITGSGTLILNTTYGSVEGIGCQIEGAIDVVKRGGGAFLLLGHNAYLGSTTIKEGTLTLGGGNFYSNLIATATVHLDATASDTITKDADGNVSAWRDADGRDIAFTNVSVSTQPVLRRGRLNGYDALYFSRPLARLTANTAAVSNRTVFIVHRNRGGGRPSGMNNYWDNAGIYGKDGADAGLRFASGSTWSQSGGSAAYSSIGCSGKVYDLTSVPKPKPTFLSDVATVSDIEFVGLHTIRAAVGDYWHNEGDKRSYYGDIGEIIAFSRVLTAFERETVRQALSAKWGVVDPELATAKQLIDMAEVHLDASVTNSITADADGNVSAWRDLSGNDNVFTNANVARQPVLMKGQINGRDSVFFGKGLAQLVSSNASLLHQTVFVVHRNKSGARPSGMSSDWGSAGIYGQNGADSGLRFSTVNTWLDNGWGNYTFIVCNGKFYDLKQSPKPTVEFTADAVTVSAVECSGLTTVRAAVGDYWNHTTYKRSYYGDVCEVIAFPRTLTSEQTSRISQYLMEKWGVVAPSTPAEEPTEESSGLPAGTALTVAGGATCDLAGVSSTVASLSGAGAVVSSGKDATLTLTSGGSFSGTFGAGLSLALGADAMWTLGAAGITLADLSGSGRIAGGPVTVTGTIRPGGAGKIGTLTLESAPVVTGATLEIDVAPGAVDKLAVEEPFDLSPLALRVPSFEGWTGPKYPILTTPVRKGRFASDNFTAKDSKFYLSYRDIAVWLSVRPGMAVLVY